MLSPFSISIGLCGRRRPRSSLNRPQITTCRHCRRRRSNRAQPRPDATYLKGKVFLLDGDTIEGKPMRRPKPTMPAENMTAVLFAAIKRHSNLNSYVDNRIERGRPFSDVIRHGHFDLNAIAADLVKELSPY
jgi:hypothetical protein